MTTAEHKCISISSQRIKLFRDMSWDVFSENNDELNHAVKEIG